ncbi:YeeE/YedE family protein [Paracoccus cavernae]|uniref:YeeE/YedE family protein n=1 Tax=Paracoccus cavernae TaxID=1571207 RepID=UPI0035F449C1
MGAALLGLTIGAVFGAAARISRFCLLRGMKALVGGGDRSPLRLFALALAVAILATQALNLWGLTDLSASLPMRPQFAAGGLFIGGAVFGIGTVMANGCGARMLVLLAGGNMRALLVLLCMGLAAQASLTGVLSSLRAALQLGRFAPEALSIPALLAFTGIPAGLVTGAVVLAATGALAVYARPVIVEQRRDAVMGVLIGLCVAAGWWAVFATDDPFDPKVLNGLSFVGPVGEGIVWLILSTGRALSFGVAVVAGTLAGAFAASLLQRSAALETFTSGRNALKVAAGGTLMGFGGVLATGCSIGQGLTGLSTLSLASLVASLGILSGIAVGLIISRHTSPVGS